MEKTFRIASHKNIKPELFSQKLIDVYWLEKSSNLSITRTMFPYIELFFLSLRSLSFLHRERHPTQFLLCMWNPRQYKKKSSTLIFTQVYISILYYVGLMKDCIHGSIFFSSLFFCTTRKINKTGVHSERIEKCYLCL